MKVNIPMMLFQASFTATKKGEDIDIDDPDFWKKWAMKADIDVDELMNKVRDKETKTHLN